MKLASIESEVVLLRNVYDHIGEMVNWSLMDLSDNDPESLIMFKDMNQRKLFFIILVDFLAKTDDRGPIKKTSFLNGLLDICSQPQFSIGGSEKNLKTSVTLFASWLREETNIDIWLPSISKETTLSISRFDAIKMCGDVSKHNYLRIISVADNLIKILKKSNINISQEQALLVLPDFYERFHDDILIYLSSHICEFLNNIRWAIHDYLQPEFNNSFQRTTDNLAGYSFKVPDTIKSIYARDCYWELMNNMRSKPYMRKFIISDSFKCEY